MKTFLDLPQIQFFSFILQLSNFHLWAQKTVTKNSQKPKPHHPTKKYSSIHSIYTQSQNEPFQIFTYIFSIPFKFKSIGGTFFPSQTSDRTITPWVPSIYTIGRFIWRQSPNFHWSSLVKTVHWETKKNKKSTKAVIRILQNHKFNSWHQHWNSS